MAVSKKKEIVVETKGMTLAEKKKLLKSVTNAINVKAKKKVCGFASDEEIQEKLKIKFLPTPSLNVNAITGGGIPAGKISIISGNADSGKTSLALEIIAHNMKLNPDFVALWLESESSIDLNEICRQFEIDSERFIVIQLDRNGAAEAAVDQLEAYLAVGVDIAVVNSLKCLVPSSEFESEMKAQSIGVSARFNSKMVRKLTALIAEHDTALVLINHLTTEIGNMYNPLQLAGGRAIRYASMLTLEINKKSIQDSDPVDRENHIKVGVAVKKNHCIYGRNPYLKCDYYASYKDGILTNLEVLENAIEQGLLTKGAGGWIRDINPETNEPRVYEDGTKAMWQGMAKFKDYCDANPEFFEGLKSKLTGVTTSLNEDEIEEIEKEEELDKKAADFVDKAE